MKKKIIPVLLTLSLFGLNMTPVYAQEGKFDPYSEVWKNKNAKEWGDTPPFVRVMVERISEKSKKTDTISPFSIIWLKQVMDDKKAYNLSDKEVEWIENTLVKTAKEKKSEWQPENLPQIAEIKTEIANKETVQDTEKSVVTNNENKEIMSVSPQTKKEEVKTSESPVKTEKVALEQTVLASKEDMEVINKEDKNSSLKEKNSEVTKLTTPLDAKKTVVLNEESPARVMEDKISAHEKIYQVPNVKIAKVMPDMNNEWMPTVLKQLGLIVIFLSLVMFLITRNSKYRISDK